MNTDPTNPKAYALWSREQLIAELVRINRLLVEMSDQLDKAEISVDKAWDISQEMQNKI